MTLKRTVLVGCTYNIHQSVCGCSAKRRVSNERRNSVLMTCHYPDLGSTSDWLKQNVLAPQPIRSAT